MDGGGGITLNNGIIYFMQLTIGFKQYTFKHDRISDRIIVSYKKNEL